MPAMRLKPLRRNSPSIMAPIIRAAPSLDFRAMFPAKPSQTTTSVSPLKIPSPSTKPT